MECIDQEGHQLQAKPSPQCPRLLLYLITRCCDHVAKEWARKKMSEVKKRFGLSGARKHSLHVSVTQ